MQTDPFSDILKLTNAEATVTGGFTAGGNWAIRFPGRDKVKFFAVVKGCCWIQLEGAHDWLRFQTGDVGLSAVNRGYILASDPSVAPRNAIELFSGAGTTTAVLGSGHEFEHIGGHVMLDPTRGGLLANVLPAWIHIKANAPEAPALQWLLGRLVKERAEALPGGTLAAAQLTQLLFIQILRVHLQSADSFPSGWLRALADRRAVPALRLMHGEPARNWHLEELANACAMSRASFAQHFKDIAGVSPLAYLTQWRMRLAEQALREEDAPVGVIADRLGYTSESAFSHAFRRVTGRSPNACRRMAQKSMGRPGIDDAHTSLAG